MHKQWAGDFCGSHVCADSFTLRVFTLAWVRLHSVVFRLTLLASALAFTSNTFENVAFLWEKLLKVCEMRLNRLTQSGSSLDIFFALKWQVKALASCKEPAYWFDGVEYSQTCLSPTCAHSQLNLMSDDLDSADLDSNKVQFAPEFRLKTPKSMQNC